MTCAHAILGGGFHGLGAGAVPFSPLVAAAVRERITSGRLEGFSEWWNLPLAALAGLLVLALVVRLYRRDAAELPAGVGLLLAALRLGAVAALVLAWLDFERTTETEIVFPSRVAVLVDSSASMTLDDAAAGTGDGRSRSARSLAILEERGLLDAVRATHEVSLWRFDAEAEPLVVLPRTADSSVADDDSAKDGTPASDELPPGGLPWQEKIAARGFETRIGEAIERVLAREPSRLLSGVVILSDGGSNAGVDAAAAAGIAGRAGTAILPIGLGSDVLPANVRIADVVVPPRVYPGDRFAVTAYVQPQELAGRTVRVELAESTTASGDGQVIDAADCLLGADGTVSAVRFDVPGIASPGNRSLTVRVVPPPGDSVAADDRQTVEVEVVDRVTEVLLLAGGPSREYQFMRNVLERDESFAVDVLLATARKGTSQDARTILKDFPETPEALDAYDAIVAFDYDWRRLDPQQLGRLERWVARESGGLVLVSGNVFMPSWVAEPGCAVVRGLSPIELASRGGLAGSDVEPGGDEPLPLEFTPDGLDAEFLWLGPSRVASESVWSEFPGVYGCYAATRAKPGATVYARVKRAGGVGSADDPIFLAGQFYGSGTVLSVGSGELWRLRSIDDAAFERIATQLVRHVSQGRLLRGSRRARLLVERDRFAVGANVAVRVVLPEGSAAGTAASPECRVTGPGGDPLRVRLDPDPRRPDEFAGSFVAGREGVWRIEVAGGPAGESAVSRSITARLPDRELQRPRLDRSLLEQVAAVSGGRAFFPGDADWAADDTRAVVQLLPDRTRREYQSGSPDGAFKRRLNTLLLASAAGLLCVEWIVRRLVRLA